MLSLRPERLAHDDYVDQEIRVSGKAFRAHMSGALYWPAERALIVADLHLEKGAAFARGGQMLPPYDTRETLTRLAITIDHYDPDTVIALGDSLHESGTEQHIDMTDLKSLRILQEDREWIWLTGNHDQTINDIMGGEVLPEITVTGITLRHEPRAGTVTHEIAGHLHPAARLVLNGTSLRRPCFVGNGRRLILPAFGAYAGGLNILSHAIEPLFGTEGRQVWMLGQEGLYPIAPRLLHED